MEGGVSYSISDGWERCSCYQGFEEEVRKGRGTLWVQEEAGSSICPEMGIHLV